MCCHETAWKMWVLTAIFKNIPWKIITYLHNIKWDGKEFDVHWIIHWIISTKKGDKMIWTKCNKCEIVYFQGMWYIDSSICLYLYLGVIPPGVSLKILNSAFKDLMTIYNIVFRIFTRVIWHHICTKKKILCTLKF